MAIIPAQEKVFMVSNGTNTTYGGSAALQAMNQWYKMQDITDTVSANLPIPVSTYKVFTALLTQSGGDNPDTTTGAGGTLNIGYTYLIIDNPDNYDLTLYGATNNLPGTYFICNNAVYDLPYTSSLQIGVNYGAPVVTVLENTIGNIWFTYDNIGVYRVKSKNLFIVQKTASLITSNAIGAGFGVVSSAHFTDISTIVLATQNSSGGMNGNLNVSTLEIRVYN